MILMTIITSLLSKVLRLKHMSLLTDTVLICERDLSGTIENIPSDLLVK